MAAGGNHYVSDSLVVNGRLAAVFGESSVENDELDPVDFKGINAEFGFEYQPSSRPLTVSGGIGYSYGAFSGSNSENERVNSAYAFVGVTYWFGGGSVASNRRQMLPNRAADYLISAESMAIGNLN